MKKLFLGFLIISVLQEMCNCQDIGKTAPSVPHKGLFGILHLNGRKDKIKYTGAARKAQKKQEAKKKKQKKDYEKSILMSQERTFEIQTPEVKTRMKQNKKETAGRNKAKKRHVRRSSRKAGKKFN
jgi:hypothetical protein